MSGLVTVEVAGILFDMDGVLVSSIGSVNRCWRKWAEHYGLPNAETVQIEHGTRAVDMIARLKPDLDVAEGLKFIEDLEIDDVADLKVLPGARALLGSLPPERWAIVTSATYRLLLGRLRAAELPVPERIISGDMVERGKPDPEPYRRGAELIHSPAAECLVVEDAPSGVGAGIAAGCRVLGVLGTHKEAELRAAGATWIVRSLEDVNAQTRPNGLTLSLNVL
ncbi:HAD-IA family hydrolase [Granulicella sp. L46]|uniref:HAD-IA family hydrolase n=1 Tax=Granulicella sp. L46 TaxID=1641865 RepID=UPI0020B15769|nr:HAD-IA family hydrolase [Granulicella sp. L46]